MPRGAASLQARLLVSRPACRIRSPAAAIHSGSCAVHPSRILRCSSIPGNTSKGRPPLPCGLPFDERRNNMVCKGVHVCLPVPSSDSTTITHLKVQWSPNFSKMEKNLLPAFIASAARMPLTPSTLPRAGFCRVRRMFAGAVFQTRHSGPQGRACFFCVPSTRELLSPDAHLTKDRRKDPGVKSRLENPI